MAENPAYAHREDEWDAFVETYKPVQNTITNREEMDGCMFETYGADLDHVRAQPASHIVTVVEAEGGLFLGGGFRVVDRMAYLITENPVPDNLDVMYVAPDLDEPEDDEDDPDFE